MTFNTLSTQLSILLLITLCTLIGFLIAKLAFYVLNQVATFRYNHAVAQQRRAMLNQQQEKLAWETEKARLDVQLTRMKIQRASGNNAALPPVQP